MLTDIFSRRYEARPLFNAVGPREHALLVQGYRIINEQVFPYYGVDKKVDESAKAIWTSLHDRLTMELGLKELSPKAYSYVGEWMGKPHTYSGLWDMNLVCESWLTKQFSNEMDADTFVKRRLSFIELAFRERDTQIQILNSQLEASITNAELRNAAAIRRLGAQGLTSGSVADRMRKENESVNKEFEQHVNELNERFRQAGMPLHYHNGYIQIASDPLTLAQIDQPFWDVVKSSKWENVSKDMATAIDLRDSGGRDPVWYAGRALESTIKIVCDDKGWTTGSEKGASDFLNHLESKANGRFVDSWERQILQAFFSSVRNDYGHGPGSAPMPTMTEHQANQSIEFCMSWIKSLVRRL